MGFRKPDLDQAYHAIRSCLVEIRSPYNDGWVSSACKHDLYLLKSWLDEEYSRLPQYAEEAEWEQKRLIDILQRR